MFIEPSLRGLLTALFRQKDKFFIIFVLVTAFGVIYVASMKPVYESQGSMLVKFGQGAVPELRGPGGQGASAATAADRGEIMQSNVKILQSVNLLEGVVKEIGVERLYPGITDEVAGRDLPERAAVNRLLAHDLRVETDARSNIIELGVRNAAAGVAAELADRLMIRFIARQAEVYGAPQTNFLQQQITAAKTQLEQSQKEFQDFKQQTGISSLDPEVTQLIKEKSDLSGNAFNGVSAAQTLLSKLESDEAAARVTYKPESPIIKRMSEATEVARAQVQKLQDDLNASGGTGSALSPKISKIDERLAYLETNRSRYEDLEQHVRMDEDNYKYYKQRGEEARVNDLLNQQSITSISIVDRPALPTLPLARHRLLVLIAFLMTAGLFALCTALGFELLDDNISQPDQITSGLGLPLLASFGAEGVLP